MATVQFDNVDKSFGERHALMSASFAVEEHEFVVLVGPSGCGKSTALRLVAGLDVPDQGRILIDGKDMRHVSPKDRGCAMVFQSYALYPHWTVYDNLAFPLKLRHTGKQDIQRRVSQIATELRLTDVLDQRPKELSGGQRQRVAVGRAMAGDPPIFLFDEPLSNLDAPLRAAMRGEIVVRQKALSKTTLYVTHDQAEALTMADRVVILDQGCVQGIGPPERLYRDPPNRFVAAFLGRPTINLLDGTLRRMDGHCRLEPLGWELPDVVVSRIPASEGRTIQVGVRAEDMMLQPWRDGRRWTVTGREFLGDKILYTVQSTEWTVTVLTDPHCTFESGTPVAVEPHLEKIMCFQPGDGQRLA